MTKLVRLRMPKSMPFRTEGAKAQVVAKSFLGSAKNAFWTAPKPPKRILDKTKNAFGAVLKTHFGQH